MNIKIFMTLMTAIPFFLGLAKRLTVLSL